MASKRITRHSDVKETEKILSNNIRKAYIYVIKHKLDIFEHYIRWILGYALLIHDYDRQRIYKDTT